MPKRKDKKATPLGFLEAAENKQVSEAKELLLNKGFVVGDPIKEDGLNNNIPALIDFFYKKMAEKYKGRSMHYGPTSTDREYVSVLVNSRKKVGTPTKRAYQEARTIIEALFEYEDLIGLKSEIKSMAILGIEWIIKKVVEVINNEKELRGDKNFSVYENDFQSYTIDSEEFKKEKEKQLDYLFRKVVNNGGEEKN